MNLKERYSQLSNKTKRTLLEDRELAYMEFRKIYEGIEKLSDITEEMVKHYFDVTDKELTADHRDIFRLSDELRRIDFENPCRPGKQFFVEKGRAIDGICEILGITKDRNFHTQIKAQELYEEDIKDSDWYRYVLNYKWELQEIFGLTIGEDFEDNPLKFAKMFCLKALGIVCKLEQQRGMHPQELEGLFKQHKKEDIYRKHYKDVFPKQRYAPTKMKACSDDWINKKISKGETLTKDEQKLRRLRKHIKISLNQPRYKRYLFDFEESPILNLEMKNGISQFKQSRGTT